MNSSINTFDVILIEGLTVEATIGVYDWEREIRQTLVFDIELDTDIRDAAASDDVLKTLDYKSISDVVVAYVKSSSFQLIESLAEAIAKLIFEQFNVTSLRIKLSKPGAVPDAKNVAIRISRKR